MIFIILTNLGIYTKIKIIFMKNQFDFTFKNLEEQFLIAKNLGYYFTTCAEYVQLKTKLPELTLVNRIDIDFSIKKADQLLQILNRLSIKASFFVRLHAPEYNPFSFENYRILKSIRDSGHEIGYHSEIIDQAAIWNEDAVACLEKDLEIMNRMLDIKVKGVASHGGSTGLNNLDFWKDKKANQFSLLYEAYDKSETFNLFNESFYISDSEWTRWKCYQNGKLVENDSRSFGEHVKDKHPIIYLLTHPDTYYNNHFYE